MAPLVAISDIRDMNYLTDCICDFEEVRAPLCGMASMVHTFTFSLKFHFSFRVKSFKIKTRASRNWVMLPELVLDTEK